MADDNVPATPEAAQPPSVADTYNNIFPNQPSVSETYNQIFAPQQAQAPEQLPTSAAPAPMQQQGDVDVMSPSGEYGSVPAASLKDALDQGYTQVTPEDKALQERHEKFGGFGEGLLAGVEGAGSAATFGGTAGLENMLSKAGVPGISPEDRAAREEEHPISKVAGQIAGLAIPGGEGSVLKAIGESAAKLAGLGEATALAKIGSSAVKAAAEGIPFVAGTEAEKAFNNDPNQTVGSVAANIGLYGILGGGAIGGSLGAVSPLWKAASGSETARWLGTIANKLGGIEGASETPMDKVISRLGIEPAPDVRARLVGDDALQHASSALEQTDTNASGLEHQAALKDYKARIGDSIVQGLGRDPESVVSKADLSTAEMGRNVGNTLASEFEQQVSPLSTEYNELQNRFKNADLSPAVADKSEEIAGQTAKLQAELAKATKAAQRSMVMGNPEAAVDAVAKVEELQRSLKNVAAAGKSPGAVDTMSQRIGQLVDKEGWAVSPSSDIMKAVNSIQEELPNVKTVNDLSNYIKAVNAKIQSDPLNGPLRRALGMVKGVLQDHEGNAIQEHLGKAEGAEAVQRYQDVRKAYAQQAGLKDALDDRLHLKGSTSGYGKTLREAANTDGETLLRRLSGKNDADILQLLQKNFPGTAQALKEAHMDQLLGAAAQKAKPGESIANAELIRGINAMSPELRNFVIPSEAQQRIKDVSAILAHLNQVPHNFANTARTINKVSGGAINSTMGLISMLTGHSKIGAALIGGLGKVISKDVPDAVKLGFLKFMGSSKPVSSEGFRAAVDYAQKALSGAKAVSSASKSVFNSTARVLVQPSQSDRDKLDKKLQSLQQNPQDLFSVGGQTSHYLPEHAQAVAQTASQATNYLNSIRPSVKKPSPLDDAIEPSPMQKASYNNALNIAQKPLLVVEKIKDGTTTPEDIQHLNAMYPSLYQSLKQKLMTDMSDHLAKGNTVPYSARLGLSMFVGQPLDSTMTPDSIVAAQPMPSQTPQNAPGPAKTKHSTSSLSKLPSQYQTPSQTREQARTKE